MFIIPHWWGGSNSEKNPIWHLHVIRVCFLLGTSQTSEQCLPFPGPGTRASLSLHNCWCVCVWGGGAHWGGCKEKTIFIWKVLIVTEYNRHIKAIFYFRAAGFEREEAQSWFQPNLLRWWCTGEETTAPEQWVQKALSIRRYDPKSLKWEEQVTRGINAAAAKWWVSLSFWGCSINTALGNGN